MIDQDSCNSHRHIFHSHCTKYCDSLSCSTIIWKRNHSYWCYTVQLFYLNRCIIFKLWGWSKITWKMNHQDPVVLFLDFGRLRMICCLLLKNEDHISNVWLFPMWREDLVHLLYWHETNDSKTVHFYESPIKWIITIASRFCSLILSIITWICPSDSPSILSYEIWTIRKMPMIMFIYENYFKEKLMNFQAPRR